MGFEIDAWYGVRVSMMRSANHLGRGGTAISLCRRCRQNVLEQWSPQLREDDRVALKPPSARVIKTDLRSSGEANLTPPRCKSGRGPRSTAANHVGRDSHQRGNRHLDSLVTQSRCPHRVRAPRFVACSVWRVLLWRVLRAERENAPIRRSLQKPYLIRAFVAEGKGFEPLVTRRPQRLSRPPHSSALATFRRRG